MKRYSPKEIEPKWQKIWDETQVYKTNDASDKPKRYVLDMYPYPSGNAMHMGHVRNYAISDVVARYERMKGHEVLHPMGWDAFGLPAENFAIKNNISPRIAIDQNTDRFREQFKLIGASYDWSREIDSSSPEYYKWTQWFFLLLHKRGLAYQKNGLQNWCPKDKTVLANEQVIVENGVKVCERCSTPVEKKELKQWFFKITEYADRLLADLDEINWPERIKAMQRNWIGRSVGAEIQFRIDNYDDSLTVFTTRPDTLFGATYMVLAPEHPLVKQITTPEHADAVQAYVKTTEGKTELNRKQDEKEKTGVFTGAYAINPVNKEKIPIWIADYVLMSYGTGAIMAVPAHDQRDYEFASKFDLPIVQVVEPVLLQTEGSAAFREDEEVHDSDGIIAIIKHWSDDTYLGLHWPGPQWGTLLTGGIDDGLTAEQTVLKEILEETGYTNAEIISKLGVIHSKYYHEPKKMNRFGHAPTFYVELKDATQESVDASETAKHTPVWLSKSELRAFLTAESHKQALDLLEGLTYSGEGIMTNSGQYNGKSSSDVREQIVKDLEKQNVATEQVNYRIKDWLISRQRYWGAPIPIIHCESCGEVPVPEDQLPVKLPEMEKFHPSDDGRGPLARDEAWVHVTCPKCGGEAHRETDTMDGFACSSWYFLRFADPHNTEAPFSKEKAEAWLPVDTYIGGAEHAVMHLLYARFWTKVMFDEGLISFDEPFKELRNQGLLLAEDGRKISKRLNNFTPPEQLISDGYGADALRTTVLFLAPYNQETPWSNEGLVGIFRFLQRVWTLQQEFFEAEASMNEEQPDLEKLVMLGSVVDKSIKKVTEDLEKMSYNTAISALMVLSNELYKLREELSFGEAKDAWAQALQKLTLMLAPFAPHMAEELWEQYGHTTSVHVSPWPLWDEKLIVEDMVTIVVQVNGKVRANLQVPTGTAKEEIISAARAHENITKYFENKEPSKTIVVPGRLVNFVV